MSNRANVRSGGAMMWLFQRVTGVYLAVVLFAHVWLLHYLLDDEIGFAAVADRVATPLWKTIDISFLVVALFHGLYGLWIVLDDYIQLGVAPHPHLQRDLDRGAHRAHARHSHHPSVPGRRFLRYDTDRSRNRSRRRRGAGA